jgi:purine-binding chemotaxis protein CheW
MMTTSQANRGSISDQAGKYLTFQLGEGAFGLEILKVREIIGLIEVTDVPLTPAHVKGVINLRGKVIPVVDLRLQFGMEEVEPTEASCIIVAHVGEREIGVLVDQVSEVLDIDAAAIEEAPSFGQTVDTDFILGMGKTAERVIILLDIHRVLAASDLEEMMIAS